MQNNNIEYLRKSIKKLSKFYHFSMIINLIISCLLVLNTILAFMKIIEFEIFLTGFLLLEVFYYLLKIKKALDFLIFFGYNSKRPLESCPSWPKEHDWKSCIRHKRIKGSNPLLSAKE